MTLMSYGKSKVDMETAKQKGEPTFSACQWLPPHDAKDAVDCHCGQYDSVMQEHSADDDDGYYYDEH